LPRLGAGDAPLDPCDGLPDGATHLHVLVRDVAQRHYGGGRAHLGERLRGGEPHRLVGAGEGEDESRLRRRVAGRAERVGRGAAHLPRALDLQHLRDRGNRLAAAPAQYAQALACRRDPPSAQGVFEQALGFLHGEAGGEPGHGAGRGSVGGVLAASDGEEHATALRAHRHCGSDAHLRVRVLQAGQEGRACGRMVRELPGERREALAAHARFGLRAKILGDACREISGGDEAVREVEHGGEDRRSPLGAREAAGEAAFREHDLEGSLAE
jgi:hypothetical protein